MKKYALVITISLVCVGFIIIIAIIGSYLAPGYAVKAVDGSTRKEIPIYGNYYYDTGFEFIARHSNEVIEIIFDSSVDSITFDSELIIIYSIEKNGYFKIDQTTGLISELKRKGAIEFEDYTLRKFDY